LKDPHQVPLQLVPDAFVAAQGPYTENKSEVRCTLNTLRTWHLRKGKGETEYHRVMMAGGSKIRPFCRVDTIIDNGMILEVLCNLVTGSLYNVDDGLCYSGQLFIVEWFLSEKDWKESGI
jgi:hypothetical protein